MPRVISRLLATLGGAIVCWLIGVLFAAAAQAAESPDTRGEPKKNPPQHTADTSTLLGTMLTSTLETVTDAVVTQRERPPAEHASNGPVSETEPSDIRAAAAELIPQAVNNYLPSLHGALSGEETTEETTDGSEPTPQETAPPPSRQESEPLPDSEEAVRLPDEQAPGTDPVNTTIERRTGPTEPGTPPARHTQPQRETHETDQGTGAHPGSAPEPSVSGTPTSSAPSERHEPAPTPPSLPEPVGIPPTSTTTSSQPHSAANSAGQTGVVDVNQPGTPTFTAVGEAVEAGDGGTANEPAMPGATPD